MRTEKPFSSRERAVRVWDDLAEFNAMWAVCTTSEYAAGRADLSEFLRSGEREVAQVLRQVAATGLPVSGRVAVDFGSGLGRLTAALAPAFEEVIGLDASAEMRRRAAEIHQDLRSCRFVAPGESGHFPLASGSADFALSLITLQHLPSPKAITFAITEMLRVVRPGGAVVFQVPVAVAARVRFHPYRLAARLVASRRAVKSNRLRPHVMEITRLGEADVKEAVEAGGGGVADVIDDRRLGSDVVASRLFICRSLESRKA